MLSSNFTLITMMCRYYLSAVYLLLIFDATSRVEGHRKILIIGGSGRVGGSALRKLNNMIFKDDEVWKKKKSSADVDHEVNDVNGVYNVLGSDGDRVRCRDIRLTVMGRDVKNWNDYVALKSLDITYIDFIAMDINDKDGYQLDAIIQEHDLIINTAGPFQGLRIPVVMEKCLLFSKKYIDVCDDIKLSRICRSQQYQDMAIKYNSTAIISTGIWPGCSSLLADDIIHHSSILGGVEQVDSVRFSFFTAGSGGAGPTILSATFLILGAVS